MPCAGFLAIAHRTGRPIRSQEKAFEIEDWIPANHRMLGKAWNPQYNAARPLNKIAGRRSGGGATLEFLAGDELPGVAALDDK